MSKAFLEEVDELIRARYPMIYVVTWEEDRVRQLLAQIAAKQRKTLFEWSITDGLRKVSGPGEPTTGNQRKREPLAVLTEILQAEVEALYVLRDFHNHIEAPEIVRQLRDLGSILRKSKKNIIFVSPSLKLPPDLEKTITIVDLPLPTYEELDAVFREKVDGAARGFRINLNSEERDAFIKAALGLTLSEAENTFARALVRDGSLDSDDIAIVAAEKRQLIRKTEVLEYVESEGSMAGVGGMDLLKDWLHKRVQAFSREARAYGLPEPRGILLMGVQGCGKSLIAKTIAASWRLPLLRMDMSRIFQSYIGSSEQNMRKAVTIAESIAPAVLWIDEVEKAFAGSGSSADTDAGTTSRVLGTFLTWLQEKTSPVFVVATANDVKKLPPELLRKGRLDEIFFIDLPTGGERQKIFAIHLQKVRRDPKKFDLNALAQVARGFSGAEIEQAIVSAMHDSFFENRELQTQDIVKSVEETVPLSTTMREKIDELRAWATDRARPVARRRAKPSKPSRRTAASK